MNQLSLYEKLKSLDEQVEFEIDVTDPVNHWVARIANSRLRCSGQLHLQSWNGPKSIYHYSQYQLALHSFLVRPLTYVELPSFYGPDFLHDLRVTVRDFEGNRLALESEEFQEIVNSVWRREMPDSFITDWLADHYDSYGSGSSYTEARSKSEDTVCA